MTAPHPFPDLAEQVTAIAGVSRLYPPRGAAALVAELGVPLPYAHPQVVIVDRVVSVRVGVDRSRAVVDIVRDIHRALSLRLAAGGLADAVIDVEIATIR